MKIYAQIALVMAEIEAVGKNQLNKAQGFKFRGIDDVYNAVHSAMAKHGVVCWPVILDIVFREKIQTRNGGEGWHQIIKVKYVFAADDGSSIDVVVFGEGVDYGDKVSNKCLAIAHKYALLQTLVIPTEDTDDPDKDVHEIVKPKPQVEKRAESARKPLESKQALQSNADIAAEIKRVVTFPDPNEPTSIDLRKTNLIAGVRESKIDFPTKIGKTIQQIVDFISTAQNEAQLDKMEARLVDLELDL